MSVIYSIMRNYYRLRRDIAFWVSHRMHGKNEQDIVERGEGSMSSSDYQMLNGYEKYKLPKDVKILGNRVPHAGRRENTQ